MVSAIVLAGGSGNRMNSSTAKQYMELCGIPVVVHALKTFQLSESVDEIVLVIRKEDMEYAGAELVGKYGLTKVTRIIPGGKERFDSVWQGVQATAHFSFAPDGEEQDVILIHDGAGRLWYRYAGPFFALSGADAADLQAGGDRGST